MRGGWWATIVSVAMTLIAVSTALAAEPVESDTAGSLRLRVSRQAPLWWESARLHLEQGRTAAAIALLEELQREAADQFVTQDGAAATADWLIQQLADRLSPADLKTWEVRSVLLYRPDTVTHGFQYADWLFEGDDLIAVSRTAFDDRHGGARNQHDANYMTFHRVENFRTRTQK